MTREFARYRSIPNHAGATGAQVARALLDAHGLSDVTIETAPGTLTATTTARRGQITRPVTYT